MLVIYPGQRCAGRNFNGRRYCTPENPCGYGKAFRRGEHLPQEANQSTLFTPLTNHRRGRL